MERRSGVVYIVDDEDPLRHALARLVERAGWTPRECESGAVLLSKLDDAHPACILLDLSMPGASGIDVQRELIARQIDLPVIFLTGGGTVPMAVAALRSGALDFLEKPVDTKLLVERIEAALLDHSRRLELASIRRRVASLTEREAEVCSLLVQGLASKQIAQKLSISVRTIEHHRERILKKTETTNTAELASLYAQARGSGPAPA